MTIEEYNKIREAFVRKCDCIASAKRPEYTEGNVDVLNNFKVVADELGLTPLQVWYVYARKHMASISQYCKDPQRQLAESIESRFGDLRNYLDLGYALLNDGAPTTHSWTCRVCKTFNEHGGNLCQHCQTLK